MLKEGTNFARLFLSTGPLQHHIPSFKISFYIDFFLLPHHTSIGELNPAKGKGDKEGAGEMRISNPYQDPMR